MAHQNTGASTFELYTIICVKSSIITLNDSEFKMRFWKRAKFQNWIFLVSFCYKINKYKLNGSNILLRRSASWLWNRTTKRLKIHFWKRKISKPNFHSFILIRMKKIFGFYIAIIRCQRSLMSNQLVNRHGYWAWVVPSAASVSQTGKILHVMFLQFPRIFPARSVTVKNRVIKNSTQSQFWLSQSLLISLGSLRAKFEPTQKI